MPYLTVNTNVDLDESQKKELLALCSHTVATMLGKPERYVMVRVESGLSLFFDGNDAPCAYLELKSLGLPEDRCGEFSKTLCDTLGTALSVPSDRIYIEFASPARHLWGWNGGTF